MICELVLFLIVIVYTGVALSVGSWLVRCVNNSGGSHPLAVLEEGSYLVTGFVLCQPLTCGTVTSGLVGGGKKGRGVRLFELRLD